MLYIDIPKKDHPLSFYLAAEEYVAERNYHDDSFFSWCVDNSVIFGRNQLIENEVNIEYCKQNGIKMFRRKSGGGCVFADRGNLMMSYITKERNANFTFYRYLNFITLALRKLGVEATVSGRNDIMVDGRKISGNAFYYSHGHSIVHGTLLHDSKLEHLAKAITPPTEKLQSKGVDSVRQHVAMLKDYTSLNLDQIREHIRETLCTETITLDESDEAAIQEIERQYLSPEFIYGNNPRYTLKKSGRIENVGQMDIRLEMKNGEIKAMNILGDYFLTGDIDREIIQPLKGRQLSKESLEKALPEDLSGTILNLDRTKLIKILTH